MKKVNYDIDSVLDTVMQIIQDEHHHFVHDGIGNDEHIPRIIRIAQSAEKLLSVGGMSKQETESNVDRIIRYGRQLFIEEWMKPFPGDTEPPDEEGAIEEFNRYLKTAKGEKRRKSSNKGL